MEEAEKKEIRKQQQKNYRARNKDKVKSWKKAWELNNIEKVKAQRKSAYFRNIKTRIKYREENLEKINEWRRNRYKIKRESFLMWKKKYQEENRDKVLNWRMNSRDRNRAGHLHSSTKKNCKMRGIEFSLTKEWIQERFDSGVCEISGITFDMKVRRSPNSPSIDRINPRGGYTPENCRMILWSLNRAFSNLGQDYFLDVFEVLLRKLRPEIFIKI